MYYYIKGELVHKFDTTAVIDCGGVGYKITTSQQSISACGKAAEQVLFYTHLYVREDIMELYGFISQEELAAFHMLISVSGVGPKAAISILSVLSAPNLALAVATNDAKAITKAQGVGPKLAQRIILDLKDKIKNEQLTGASSVSVEFNDTENEAVSALVVLGYSAQEAQNALSKADAMGLPADQAIKKALTHLMR